MQLDDSMPLAALTIGQAKEMIGKLVCEELRKVQPKAEKQEPDAMTIYQTVEFFGQQGVPFKKKTIYTMVSAKNIPYRKVGKRIVFSRAQLRKWINEQAEHETSKADAALLIAEKARQR